MSVKSSAEAARPPVSPTSVQSLLASRAYGSIGLGECRHLCREHARPSRRHLHELLRHPSHYQSPPSGPRRQCECHLHQNSGPACKTRHRRGARALACQLEPRPLDRPPKPLGYLRHHHPRKTCLTREYQPLELHQLHRQASARANERRRCPLAHHRHGRNCRGMPAAKLAIRAATSAPHLKR